MVSPHLFQDDQCPRRAFTLKWLVLWEALAQPQGLRGSAASAIVPDGLERAPSPKQQPKGSCKFQFENHPSGLSPHLEDVGSSWPWVLDAVDGEDKRGQDIDCKT